MDGPVFVIGVLPERTPEKVEAAVFVPPIVSAVSGVAALSERSSASAPARPPMLKLPMPAAKTRPLVALVATVLEMGLFCTAFAAPMMSAPPFTIVGPVYVFAPESVHVPVPAFVTPVVFTFALASLITPEISPVPVVDPCSVSTFAPAPGVAKFVVNFSNPVRPACSMKPPVVVPIRLMMRSVTSPVPVYFNPVPPVPLMPIVVPAPTGAAVPCVPMRATCSVLPWMFSPVKVLSAVRMVTPVPPADW